MKYFIITTLFLILIKINKAYSDVLPNDIFSSVEVVELQMNSLQTNSKINDSGIWSGDFIAPWKWRRMKNKKVR